LFRNCTWPGDDFVFNLTLRTDKYSANHAFSIKVLQKWEAGSYVKSSRVLQKFKVTFYVKPEYKKTFFGGTKRTPVVARAVHVHMPQRDLLLPTTAGVMIKLSYSLYIEHHGGQYENCLLVVIKSSLSRFFYLESRSRLKF